MKQAKQSKILKRSETELKYFLYKYYKEILQKREEI